ncbi:PREDICTED: uncharacterized protein LOC18614119 [Theobroma cacao]|uniref:Uncharacterized protein LOC18614119 n=1 Tax=Theobroma cacao TaxID=3641 RepID=A0AB32WYI4_THECC|nr:PREDICTED: uncharacterized protein LOC18614119 [Theobroma cacao]
MMKTMRRELQLRQTKRKHVSPQENESTVIAKINSQAKVHDTYEAEIKEELCCDECNGKFDEEGIPIHNDPIGVDEVPVEGDAASSGAKDVSTKGFGVQIDCNDFLPSDLQRKSAVYEVILLIQ